jgi:hypothetical protein
MKEYKIYFHNSKVELLEDKINTFAKEGWIVHSLTKYLVSSTGFSYYETLVLLEI